MASVEHPDFVAERAVLGLVRGENEIILAGHWPGWASWRSGTPRCC